MDCNFPPLGWIKKAMTKLGIVTDFSYCSYTSAPNLALTSTYQKLTVFDELIPPVKVSLVNGDFTALAGGVFQWHLERIYQNNDQNPSDPPVQLFIEVRKNSLPIFSRQAPMGSANSPSEPSIDTYSSPFIIKVDKGDVFNFWFKAEDGLGSTPQNVSLTRVQLIANKIHNR